MYKLTVSPEELQARLESWAEESLANIAIFKETSGNFDGLKKKVIDRQREAFSDKGIEKILFPDDSRKIDSPDGFARITGPCGDTMEIYLKIEDGNIIDSSFQTDGCHPSVVAGGMTAEMVRGQPCGRAAEFTQQDVLDALGGLPKDSEHCALLAVNTLKEALKNYGK